LSRNQLYVLIADAFATYAMGPAYACAAIWLRFNPFLAYSDQPGTPGDAKRATMVFEILKHMNAATSFTNYDGVIRLLEDAWASALVCAKPPGELDRAQVTYLSDLAERAFRTFSDRLLPTAPYPAKGWLDAQDWVQQRREDHRAGRRWQDRTDVGSLMSPIRSLRDILNAAWCARVQSDSAWVREYDLAGLVLKLCLAITQPPEDRVWQPTTDIPPSPGGGTR
jgi:hypothetical protein